MVLVSNELSTERTAQMSTIIDRIENYLNTYMVFPDPDQATVCALWTLHTWTFGEGFAAKPMTTPYLYINSEGPRSGKTLLIDLLEPIVLNPERTVDMTSSVMFRLIEMVHPTLFVDEVDAIWSGAKNEGLRGVLNGGYKHSGYVWRNVGGEPVKFGTFSPKLLAGIDNGMLPDTVASRSINIRLKRVATLNDDGELVAPDGTTREIYYSFMAEEQADQLVKEIKAFMAEWTAEYERYIPKPIPGINPRAWEIAFPLVQIAHALGVEAEICEVLARIFAPQPEKDTPGVAMLRTIKGIFEDTGADKLHTAQICEALGSGWNGKLLSNRLKEFHITPPTTMLIGNKTLKGYYKHQFTTAWEDNL